MLDVLNGHLKSLHSEIEATEVTVNSARGTSQEGVIKKKLYDLYNEKVRLMAEINKLEQAEK